MFPVFANPAGLWALLAVPTILAIHFLQQKSRILRTSAWFLVEKLAPDSVKGRKWDRIRMSRQLIYQLLAAILVAWVLGEPRWLKSESAQTVVIVLDASASMDAFRAEAAAAAETEVNAADGLASRTTWVVMTTDPAQPPLYRGALRGSVATAVAAWDPLLGEHDAAPALRLARGLAGDSGRMLFITDSKKRSASGVRTAGVGKPIDNVGFSGMSAALVDGTPTWRALIRNHTDSVQKRVWRVVAPGGQASPDRTIELQPGAMSEVSGTFPEAIDEMTVILSADKFGLDDQLPVVRPLVKPITLRIEGSDDAAKFFGRVASNVEGVKIAKPGEAATLKISRLSAEALKTEPSAGVFWPPTAATAGKIVSAPVTPERSSLVDSLNWQAWIGTGVHGYVRDSGDAALLWQDGSALAFTRPAADRRKLLLALDWDRSNSGRSEAMVLMVRRFIEEERDGQRAFFAMNFDGGQRIPLTGLRATENPVMTYRPLGRPAVTLETPRAGWRSPRRPGFFTIKSVEEVLVRGAAQFADARQGDFKLAETFRIDTPAETRRALESNSIADPLTNLWLAAAGALLLASWYERSLRRSSSVSQVPPAVGSAKAGATS